MALSLVHDCPHCEVEKVGFTFGGGAVGNRSQGALSYLFVCNNCDRPVCASARGYPNLALDRELLHGDFHTLPISDRKFFPGPKGADIPPYCSAAVAEAFRQAEDSLRRGNKEAAVAMDRRALDVGTKEVSTEAAAIKNLGARIRYLADNHLITPSLRGWADSLRTVGNDGLHEIDGVTDMEAKQTHELARYVLIYLFTLPKQVELAQTAKSP